VPSDQHTLKQPPNGPTNLPSARTGYTVVVLSVLFFLITGYVTFFSAFISPPPNLVRDLDNALLPCRPSDRGEGFKNCSRGYPLQVLGTVFDTHLLLLHHRELGGVAILPEFMKQSVLSADRDGIHY